MTRITLSRRYSGFQNVADTYVVGDDSGHAGSVGDYELPAGYALDYVFGVPTIFDSEGYECGIYPHKSGPQLISKAGPVKTDPILKAAE